MKACDAICNEVGDAPEWLRECVLGSARYQRDVARSLRERAAWARENALFWTENAGFWYAESSRLSGSTAESEPEESTFTASPPTGRLK